MSDSSIALKPVIDEPSKPMPSVEGVVELGAVDREGLQLTEDVGEPQPDEADVALGDDGLDVVGRLRAIGGMAGSLVRQRFGGFSRPRRARSALREPALRPALELVDGRGRARAPSRSARTRRAPGGPGARCARRRRAPRAPSCARTAGGPTARGPTAAISPKRSVAAVDEHADDRAGPAPADELDRLVVERTAAAGARRRRGVRLRVALRPAPRTCPSSADHCRPSASRQGYVGRPSTTRLAASACPRRIRRPARRRRR